MGSLGSLLPQREYNQSYEEKHGEIGSSGGKQIATSEHPILQPEIKNDKYEDKSDSDFTHNIENFLSGMPNSLLETWKDEFPENVHFGKRQSKDKYKNENRKWYNWTKLGLTDLWYQGGYDSKHGFDGKGITILPKKAIIVANWKKNQVHG